MVLNLKGKIILAFVIFVSCGQINGVLNIDEASSKIAEEIIDQIKENSKIAVVGFSDINSKKSHPVSNRLSENIITQIVMKQKSQITVIERNLIDRALKELKFQLSDLVDSNSVKRFGKFLGVDLVVTGTIDEQKDAYSVNVRAIDVENLAIVSATKCKINISEAQYQTTDKIKVIHLEIEKKGFFSNRERCIVIHRNNQSHRYCFHKVWELIDAKLSPDKKMAIVITDGFHRPSAISVIKTDGSIHQVYHLQIPGYSYSVAMKNLMFIDNRTIRVYISVDAAFREKHRIHFDNRKLSGDGSYEITFDHLLAVKSLRKIS